MPESVDINPTCALAVEGGRPIRSAVFPRWPSFDEEMIEAVSAVLRSGKVNAWTGTEVGLFEREFADFIGARHAVAVANGTVALELALEALGIGAGDEVIVPSRTFVATASSVIMRGAKPVVADIDRDSQNLSADAIQAVLTPRTKAVIAVHLAGWPCDMDPIMELADQHNLKVIEDCAQAHGATYKGRHVGSIGHAAAFSFCQDKIITTGGEGGLVTTNDDDVWERAWSFKDHGKSWQAVQNAIPGSGFNWLHGQFGTNWRMTEMQAAIGRIALCRLPKWIEIRRRHAAQLTTGLRDEPSLRTPVPPHQYGNSYYKYYTFVRPQYLQAGWTRDQFITALQAEGVPCGSGSCSEIYRERAFVRAGLAPAERFPNSRELGETSLMFMVHPTLSEVEIQDTLRAVKKVLHQATSRSVALRNAA